MGRLIGMSQEGGALGIDDRGQGPAGDPVGQSAAAWAGGGQAGGLGGPAAAAPGDSVTITVNMREYPVLKQSMTAKEIKDMAGAPAHHMLILVGGEPGKAGEGSDEPQADADIIKLAPGMRFRAVNSATFGSQAAMQAPPLLQDHVRVLESRGFAVEVTVSDAIYIVIKDYPIPEAIWDRSSSDLLVMAYDTYPNAPLDMFWLDPPVSRRNGQADGVGTETRNGREWQSFSWHIGGWDPAHDSLLTYLDVVDDRLRRDR